MIIDKSGELFVARWLTCLWRLAQFLHQFHVPIEAGVDERTRIVRELHDTLRAFAFATDYIGIDALRNAPKTCQGLM